MNIFGTDYSFNKLRLPVNKTDWVRHARPAVVNAFYSSLENSIRKFKSLSIRKIDLLIFPHSRVSGWYSSGSLL